MVIKVISGLDRQSAAAGKEGALLMDHAIIPLAVIHIHESP